MYKLINPILMEFFNSEFWTDNASRIFATFGFSAVGTVTNAIPTSELTSVVQQTSSLQTVIEIFTIGSYLMSILVAATVIYRFHVWLKERKPIKKAKKHGSDSNIYHV